MAVERTAKEPINPLWYVVGAGGVVTLIVGMIQGPKLVDALYELHEAMTTPLESESVEETLRCHGGFRQIPVDNIDKENLKVIDGEWITKDGSIICKAKTGR